MKRIIIATLLGLVFGFVCYAFASSSGELPYPIALQIIASRTLIGFTIGISRLKMHWVLHGLFIGFLYSLPLSLSGMLAATPEFSATMMLVSTAIMGGIYGLLIELVTSVLFKARVK